MKQIIVNSENLQTRIALVVDGRIEEYYIEREGTRRIVGSIYKGRIRNLEPSLQAAFVDIGFDKNAFLHYWDMIPATKELLEGTADGDDDDNAGSKRKDRGRSGKNRSDDNDDNESDGQQESGRSRGRGRGRRRRNRDQQNDNRNQQNNREQPNGDKSKQSRSRSAGKSQSADQPRSPGSDARQQAGKSASPAAVMADSVPEPGNRTGFSTTIKKFLTGRFFASREGEESAPTTPAATATKESSSNPRSDHGSDNRQNRQDKQDGNSGNRSRGGENQRERNSGGNQGRNQNQDNRNQGGGRGRSKNQDNRNQGGNRDRDTDRGDGRRNSRDGKSNRGNRRSNNRRRKHRPRRDFDLDEIPKKFAVGSDVVVQVSKGMIGDKGPRVTTNLSIPGRYVVLLPNSTHRGVSRRIENRNERGRLRQMIQKADLPKNMGLICRTAAEGLSEEELAGDIAYLVEKWEMAERLRRRRAPVCVYQEPNLLERCLRDFLGEHVDEIVVDSERDYKAVLRHLKYIEKERRPRVRQYDKATPLFEHYKISEQISNLFRRKITLASGAEVCFDETEALIAVDVNSGKSRGGKDHPETILNTNLEAAEEIGRQLRIRNVGGLVVIDFIDMRSRKDQQKVYRKMREILSRDRAKSKILPLSRLGLMQMTRQREHASLQKAVYEPCHYCGGRGLVKSSTTISVEIQRRLQEVMRRNQNQRVPLRVTVHPRVLQRLKHEDADILDAMEHEHGGELTFRADEAVHQEEFHVINTETGKEL